MAIKIYEQNGWLYYALSRQHFLTKDEAKKLIGWHEDSYVDMYYDCPMAGYFQRIDNCHELSVPHLVDKQIVNLLGEEALKKYEWTLPKKEVKIAYADKSSWHKKKAVLSFLK